MHYLDLPLLSTRPVPVIGTGAMPLSNGAGGPLDRESAIAVLHRAFDRDLTLVDTADIYAPDAERLGHNEQLVGEAVRTWSGRREGVVVVTKIGITRRPGLDGDEWGRDGSLDHLISAAEASVARLGFEPDAILLHRVNRAQQSFAQTVENLLQVRERGIVSRVGIGNVHLDECEIAWEVSGGTIAASEIKDMADFKKKVTLLFVSYGSREPGSSAGQASIEALKKEGVNGVSYESPMTAHEWQSWRRSLHEFAQLAFQK